MSKQERYDAEWAGWSDEAGSEFGATMMSTIAAADRQWVHCLACDGSHSRPAGEKYGFTFVSCRTCGLVYVNPRPTRAALAAFYRKVYFSADRPDGAGVHHLHHAEAKLATAKLRLEMVQEFCAKGRLLDVGCAGGFLVQAADLAGWCAVGMDINPDAGRRSARARRAHREVPIRQVTGLAEESPFAPGRFDVVALLDVLEHVASPAACLFEARRLLAPGGVLLLETPNMDGWLPRVAGCRHPWVRPPEHLTHFGPESLRLLLDRTGFHLRRLESRVPTVLTMEYICGLATSTNPLVTKLAQVALGWWHGLWRHPFRVRLDSLVAVATVAPAWRGR